MPVAVTTDVETPTREHVLHLVVAHGPVSAGHIATTLGLTGAAVRRHLLALEADGKVAARPAAAGAERGRGRPARLFVATTGAHEQMASSYAELAVQALQHLAETAGGGAVRVFADGRAREIERRYAPAVAAAGADVGRRAGALADALDADGYEATARPARGTVVQLCQGHCPLHRVAATFPELCEAETAAFERLLGVPVQRLATIAGGGHACTTSIQTRSPGSRGSRATALPRTSRDAATPGPGAGHPATLDPSTSTATVEGQR